MEIELNFFFLLRSHLPSMSLCFATILQFREQIDPFTQPMYLFQLSDYFTPFAFMQA